jgi:hypothetical protein
MTGLLPGHRWTQRNLFSQDFIRVYQCHPWFFVFKVISVGPGVVLKRLVEYPIDQLHFPRYGR